MKSLKVLAIFLILITSSGCANRFIEPLCLPDRPDLEPISVAEQADIKPSTLLKIAENDLKLKSWVVTAERITEEHNEQFSAKCYRDTE